MSKHQSNFERNSRDFYPTPYKAVLPLTNYIGHKSVTYVEPFAGDGALIKHFMKASDNNMMCIYASDIEPLVTAIGDTNHPKGYNTIEEADYRDVCGTLSDTYDFDHFISNPPWINSKSSGFQRLNIIHTLASIKPTWLLLKGAYAFNENMSDVMSFCTDIIPIGRVKWIPDSKHTDTEDSAWFKFDKQATLTHLTGPVLHPRKKV